VVEGEAEVEERGADPVVTTSGWRRCCSRCTEARGGGSVAPRSRRRSEPGVAAVQGTTPLWQATDDLGLDEMAALLRQHGAR